MLTLILAAVGWLVLTALSAAVASRSGRAVQAIGGGGIGACVLGSAASGMALWRGESADLRFPWTLPLGGCHVGLDALSAFFLLCIFVVSGLAAMYGAGYLRADAGRRRLASAVAFYNLLVASMAVVTIARDSVLFLLAWEAMALASFFLVVYESDRPEVRAAGWTYLIASHIGVAFLIVLFVLLGRGVGSFDFAAIAAAPPAPVMADICFVLAVIGFGTKAGFWPLHIWLPEAHPAAPSHVSAVMSGVMIKMGIYGLLRALNFFGPPPGWWGMLVILIGGVSGIVGILQALAQTDLKRMLAYSSVENIGIIALGVGIGLIGQSHSNPLVSFLGFAGALLHVLNHGLFKGLLFQCAGSVLHGTGSRDMETLGAVQKRMPVTALTFLTASVAICGLPPLNGFVGEWLMYVGAFRSAGQLAVPGVVPAVLVILALSLIGGLAVAGFVRVYGVVFLGAPRSEPAAKAHESNVFMLVPMVIGAGICVVIGLFPGAAVRLVSAPAAALSHVDAVPPGAVGSLASIGLLAASLIGLVIFLALVRAWLLSGRKVEEAKTWGCGYAAPSARMQYTAASFAQPLLEPFETILPKRVLRQDPAGYFPDEARREEHAGDAARDWLILPAFDGVKSLLGRVNVIQQGRIQLYLSYVLITLIALLIWHLSRGQ